MKCFFGTVMNIPLAILKACLCLWYVAGVGAEIFYQSGRGCYVYSDTHRRKMTQARDYCATHGGSDLAMYNTLGELNYISSLGMENEVFVGARRNGTGLVFLWLDGSPVKPAMWDTGEPAGHTDCVTSSVVDGRQVLRAKSCSNTRSYLCESMPPENEKFAMKVDPATLDLTTFCLAETFPSSSSVRRCSTQCFTIDTLVLILYHRTTFLCTCYNARAAGAVNCTEPVPEPDVSYYSVLSSPC